MTYGNFLVGTLSFPIDYCRPLDTILGCFTEYNDINTVAKFESATPIHVAKNKLKQWLYQCMYILSNQSCFLCLFVCGLVCWFFVGLLVCLFVCF